LHHAPAAHALTEVFVGRQQLHLVHAAVFARHAHRRGERIVGLELLHRPHGHAHRPQRTLEHRNLAENLGLHPLTRLVAGPQIVAKTFDHMVGRDTDVRRTIFNQLQRAREGTDDPRVLVLVGVAAELAVELSIQLVSSVDEVDDHDAEPRRSRAAPATPP